MYSKQNFPRVLQVMDYSLLKQPYESLDHLQVEMEKACLFHILFVAVTCQVARTKVVRQGYCITQLIGNGLMLDIYRNEEEKVELGNRGS